MDEFQMLVAEWRMGLRARGKSPKTIKNYLDAAEGLYAFLTLRGYSTTLRAITRSQLEEYIVDQLDKWSESTAATRYRCLQQFFRFLVENEELDRSPMANMRPPTIPDKGTRVLADEELAAILATCNGRSFEDRRDQAILRLLISTGARRSEMAGLTLDDIDLDRQTVTMMGKGARARACSFGARTGQALSRYLRIRARHPHASSRALWLGMRGPMTHFGVAQMVKRRATEAGLKGVHAHLFRHTAAHVWLAAGGAEGDLMRLAGWSSREMIDRYARSSASERAQDAHRRLALDDRV